MEKIDPDKVFQRLKSQLAKAEMVLKGKEEALKADPNNFAKKLTLASFGHHVEDLRTQVAKEEKKMVKARGKEITLDKAS